MPRSPTPAQGHCRDIHRLGGEPRGLLGDGEFCLASLEGLGDAATGLTNELACSRAVLGRELLEGAVEPGDG